MPMDLVYALKWVKSVTGCLLYTFHLSVLVNMHTNWSYVKFPSRVQGGLRDWTASTNKVYALGNVPADSTRSMVDGSKWIPVSSRTSRLAASMMSSPGSIRPAGKYHWPAQELLASWKTSKQGDL